MRIRGPRRHAGLPMAAQELTSMIDVTFLLLVYFMVTSVIAVREDRLRTALEAQGTPEAGDQRDFQEQVVEATVADGRPVYRLGGLVLEDRGELGSRLAQLPTSLGLVVRVDDRVSTGFAVAALQTARDAGFEEIRYEPAR